MIKLWQFLWHGCWHDWKHIATGKKHWIMIWLLETTIFLNVLNVIEQKNEIKSGGNLTEKYNWRKHLKDKKELVKDDFWRDNELKRELGLARVGNNHWNRSKEWKRK